MTIAFNLSTLLNSTTTNVISIATATNFSGGTAGAIPYQSSTGTTAFLSPGSAGQFLQSNGTSAPTWGTIAYTTASVVQYLANGTGVNLLTPVTVWAAMAPVSIGDATTITIDLNSGVNFSVVTTSTIGPTRVMANPNNIKVGQTGWITVQQSTTGSNVMTFGNQWHFSTGTNNSLSTTANAVDIIYYTAISSSYILATIAKQWY